MKRGGGVSASAFVGFARDEVEDRVELRPDTLRRQPDNADVLLPANTDLVDDGTETELVMEPSQGEALDGHYESHRVSARDTDDIGRTHVVARLHPSAIGRFERQFGAG